MENLNILRLVVKTLILLVLITFVLSPLLADDIGKISLYNLVFPGRNRFPYSDNPSQSYNMSLFDLEANFASHIVSNRSSVNEYRVFVIGDSSVWGTLLEPEDTLVGQLNLLGLNTTEGDPVIFYNLGYPTLSLAKDLFFLANAMEYQPDLIIWLFTLESFPNDKQLISPIIANNHEKVSSMINRFNLDLNPDDQSFVMESFWDSTLIGQRRNLADIFRLQLYGLMWAITGIDQYYPLDYEKADRHFEEDSTFHDWQPGEMSDNDLAYDLIQSGHDIAGNIPLILVNEPILIGEGKNSNLRYNFYYPIWAYDQYRLSMQTLSMEHGWNYTDLWNLVPEEEFTNTAIHFTPEGVTMTVKELSGKILGYINR